MTEKLEKDVIAEIEEESIWFDLKKATEETMSLFWPFFCVITAVICFLLGIIIGMSILNR